MVTKTFRQKTSSHGYRRPLHMAIEDFRQKLRPFHIAIEDSS